MSKSSKDVATSDKLSWSEVAKQIAWMDADLDDNASPAYKAQPLAQDWARIAKLSEEVGEAIEAWIGVTAQNPRKGEHGTIDDVLDELADVVLTGLAAIQHFTKDSDSTLQILSSKLDRHIARRKAQTDGKASSSTAPAADMPFASTAVKTFEPLGWRPPDAQTLLSGETHRMERRR